MTEAPSSAAGADLIDAYIDSVERVLLGANVAPSERTHVLADLETQISDMLEQQVLPITAEKVAAVIAELEPPSHFAAIYGVDSAELQTSISTHQPAIPYNPWVLAAAASSTLIVLCCLLLLVLAAGNVVGPFVAFVALVLVTNIVVAPIALRKGCAQLRAEADRFCGRELAIASAIAYGVTVPILLLVLTCVLTEGYILFPIAIAAFIYFQAMLIRKVCNRMIDAAPTQSRRLPFWKLRWRFVRPAETNSSA